MKKKIQDLFWSNDFFQIASIIAGITLLFTVAGAVVTFVNLFWWGIEK